ncbi:fluoride efflux transporter CrcB [Pseudalkalibacillus decolorationis]|uniref:fluoride efflux transporter CrcB n=1 Tax=Pseudalkalibacillus decolorationis TaxID=163879 RepID=UPI002147B535|nr:fluoride efflux transporter CrcB [Pseudalkalibacillus decolorationis]
MITLIGLGGAFGAYARYSTGILIKKYGSGSFPYGTWIVNIAGSLILGVLTSLFLSGEISDGTWYFSGVGFCGAFTTFSTFSYETIQLLQEEKYRIALTYVMSSVIIGGLATVVGLFLPTWI